MSWGPVYCFAALTVIFVISEMCSRKTKGYVSFLVFASIFLPLASGVVSCPRIWCPLPAFPASFPGW